MAIESGVHQPTLFLGPQGEGWCGSSLKGQLIGRKNEKGEKRSLPMLRVVLGEAPQIDKDCQSGVF